MKIIVSYDLRAPGQNYTSFYRALRCLEAVKITESCWLIHSQKNVFELRDYLSQFLDYNDILFVARTREFSQKNLTVEAIDILT